MAKLNDIRALAESHSAEIARSVQAWTGYLDTAATLYRYDFPETLLIHAQRPDATACAEMEIWNNRMGRWVNRGSKGIALIDDSGPRKSLRYPLSCQLRRKPGYNGTACFTGYDT